MELGRHIEAARAFLMLDMGDDALEELEAAGAAHRNDPDVLELKAAILMRRKDWASALRILEFLCRALPFSGDHFMHAAFCLHEMRRTREAKERLLAGPSTLKKRALYHYNLACYEAQLGDLPAARLALDRAFAMDDSFRAVAREDRDLAPLREMA
ncbi:MAG: hypothetical protein IT577_20575 [Verrucomicrobiae bacterium]|nr:hypothetical protein [Verrucomicrobiae bacterium]